MERGASGFVRDVLFVGSSNLLTLLIATLGVFIIPKFVSQETFGFWQLYLFYSAYVGFLHFGWVDGIYLRYGGRRYSSLSSAVFSSQFLWLSCLQIGLGVGLSCGAVVLVAERHRQIVFIATAVCIVLVNMRTFLLYVLQVTGRMRAYSRILIVDRLGYSLLVVALLAGGGRALEWLLLADLTGKGISFAFAIWSCRWLVLSRPCGLRESTRESLANIRVGFKLLVANIAGLAIFGIVRIGIERSWDIVTFGQVSLAMNVSNLLMVFVSAVGVVIYPALKRSSIERLPDIYMRARSLLMGLLLLGMVLYYPMRAVISFWLPNYLEALKYLAMLLPVCLFEGRLTTLVSPFLNALRRESVLMRLNVLMVAVSCAFTLFAAAGLRNLHLTVLTILLVAVARCLIGEHVLKRYLGVRLGSVQLLELGLVMMFLFGGWYLRPLVGAALYVSGLIVYAVLQRRQLATGIGLLQRRDGTVA